MCLLLLFQVIRPIITNPITITSVRLLIFPDVLWFFRGSALSQIVSHRPENVADQAPSRNDVTPATTLVMIMSLDAKSLLTPLSKIGGTSKNISHKRRISASALALRVVALKNIKIFDII